MLQSSDATKYIAQVFSNFHFFAVDDNTCRLVEKLICNVFKRRRLKFKKIKFKSSFVTNNSLQAGLLRAPGQVLGAPSVFKCVRMISLISVCIYILKAKSESTGKYELFQGWSWTGPGLREEIENCLRYYNM